jgi:enoyl-CoA hydratase/carnithine racemase
LASDTVLCERDGPVAIVRLNRPEKRNAINRELSTALAETFAQLEADDSVLAIVLTGAGDKAFCAGADMSEQAERLGGGPQQQSQAANAYGAVAEATKPVVAAINGYAFGGGALLAANCDIRLASETATIRFVGASYGLVVGGTQLPQIIGPAFAKELLFTAKVIDAREAERIGFVNHVLPAQALLSAAIAMAKQIAENSPDAVRWAKRVVDAATVIEQGREVDAEANRVLRASADHATRFREAAKRVTGRDG